MSVNDVPVVSVISAATLLCHAVERPCPSCIEEIQNMVDAEVLRTYRSVHADLIEDEDFRALVRNAINYPGIFTERRFEDEPMVEFQDRALAEALRQRLTT